MIWNSTIAMGFFDLFFIAAAVTASIVLIRRRRLIEQAGAFGHMRLIVIGIVIWSSVYLIDLMLMLSSPVMMSMSDTMQTMTLLHLNVRWFIDAAAAACLLLGFVGLVRQFDQTVGADLNAKTLLARELESRDDAAKAAKTELQAQRASLRSKAEFLLGLSHELRTPLNGIAGLSNLLANTNLDADQRKLLTTLDESAHAMLTRVNDVLELSRLESGNVELRSAIFKPSELASSIAALYAPIAAEKDVRLVLENRPSGSDSVVGDQLLIKQLVSNLLSHAVKNAEPGELTLFASAETVNDERGSTNRSRLTYSVSGAATGLPEETVERLRRDDPLLTEQELGVGLSICRKITSLMDGQLSVETSLGRAQTITAMVYVQSEPSPVAQTA